MSEKSSTTDERGKNVIDLSEYRSRKSIRKQSAGQKTPDASVLIIQPPSAWLIIELRPDRSANIRMQAIDEYNAADMLRAIARAICEVLEFPLSR